MDSELFKTSDAMQKDRLGSSRRLLFSRVCTCPSWKHQNCAEFWKTIEIVRTWKVFWAAQNTAASKANMTACQWVGSARTSGEFGLRYTFIKRRTACAQIITVKAIKRNTQWENSLAGDFQLVVLQFSSLFLVIKCVS